MTKASRSTKLKNKGLPFIAGMAELADAADSKAKEPVLLERPK
jgi:hypothetical protein